MYILILRLIEKNQFGEGNSETVWSVVLLWKVQIYIFQNHEREVKNFLMIFDDEYLVSGSGKLDEKCLDGSLDTNMGVCAFQEKYTSENSLQRRRGDLYRFTVDHV